MKIFYIIPLIIASVYLLYINGFGTLSCKTALSFIGRNQRKNNVYSASFTSCSGQVRRVIRVKTDGYYDFCGQPAVSKGFVSLELQDFHKNPLVILDMDKQRDKIYLQSGEKYYLAVNFHRASGSYSAKIQPIISGENKP